MKTEISEAAEVLAKQSGKSAEVIQQAINEANQQLKQPPTKEQVITWFKSDLHAAAYSLQAIISMPLLMEQIAEKFYNDVVTRHMETKEAENKVETLNGKTPHA